MCVCALISLRVYVCMIYLCILCMCIGMCVRMSVHVVTCAYVSVHVQPCSHVEEPGNETMCIYACMCAYMCVKVYHVCV